MNKRHPANTTVLGVLSYGPAGFCIQVEGPHGCFSVWRDPACSLERAEREAARLRSSRAACKRAYDAATRLKRERARRLKQARRLIERRDTAAFDLAAEHSQAFDNVAHMRWFTHALACVLAGEDLWPRSTSVLGDA